MNPAAVEKLSAFWNQRYAGNEFAYGMEANDFLVSVWPQLAPGGTVLCLADGEGRNGVWLAQQGFVVTAIDIAERGLEKAQRLAAQRGVSISTRAADVTDCDLGSGAWDAIVSIFLHLPPRARRELHQRCVAALRPGGFLVFEAYGPGQLERATGGPKEPELLPSIGELEDEFPGCRIIHRFGGLREVHEGSHHNGLGEVVQVLAQRES